MATDDIQTTLRFLSYDAKLPLASAMGKVKDLQQSSLMTPEAIAKSDLNTLISIFNDEKLAKQVYNAAKRVSKKRTAPDGALPSSPSKRGKNSHETSHAPEHLEETLALPTSEKSPEALGSVELFTNRAPLVLAFCLTLLKYTIPQQPLSSRLSLAHAYVSVSSRSRAVDLGIEAGESAQDQGWGAGQPVARIMGKDIRVMRRPDYPILSPHAEAAAPAPDAIKREASSQDEQEFALWALDLEALKGSALAKANMGRKNNTMPIYTPQSARNYLLRAAGPVPQDKDVCKTTKKQSAKERTAEIERNLGMLLKTIDLLYESWASELGRGDLDSRTWAWYAQVRPDIASGKAGWGAKNVVKLKDILALCKTIPDAS